MHIVTQTELPDSRLKKKKKKKKKFGDVNPLAINRFKM
jgi:hypothetical protein